MDGEFHVTGYLPLIRNWFLLMIFLVLFFLILFISLNEDMQKLHGDWLYIISLDCN